MATVKHRRLLLLGITLLITGVVVLVFGVLQKKKSYRRLDFTRELTAIPSFEISGFDPTDGWKGDITFENGLVQEGEYSLTLTSLQGRKNTVELEQSIPTDGFGKMHLQYYIKDEALPSTVFQIHVKNQKRTFSYKIKELSPGWHVFSVEKDPGWTTLKNIAIELRSPSEKVAQIQLDRLWLTSGTVPESILNLPPSQPPVHVKTQGKRTYLYLTSLTQKPYTYTLSKQFPAKPSQLTLGFISERNGMFALSVGGYTFRIAGPGMGRCSIEERKGGRVLAEKKLTAAAAGKDLYTFMRVIYENSTFSAYLSGNDVDYELCATIKANPIQAEPLSFEVLGSYLIDSLYLEY